MTDRALDPHSPPTSSSEPKDKETLGSFLWFVTKLVLVVLIFRSFIFSPFTIPSESMLPNLRNGDYLVAAKWPYGFSKYSLPGEPDLFEGRFFASLPERGDVAIFKHPVTGVDYVKRVIGLPGDKVQVTNGVLYVNGVEATQVPDGQFIETFDRQGPAANLPQCSNPSPGLGADCIKERLTETLPNGVTHSILNIGRTSLDDTSVFTVPEGQFFFMGDNRDNSTDSRVEQPGGVGMVPFENLIGRADRIMFSSAGRSMLFFWTWRSDRFFEAIE